MTKSAYSCYAIDDESYSIRAITGYIERCPELYLIGSNTNPLVALEQINNGPVPDIVFLDVDMPKLSGLEVAKRLPKSIAIIFFTAHSRYALEGFDNDAVDFLLKPVPFERFAKAVNKTISLLEKYFKSVPQNKFFLINSGVKGTSLKIEIDSILYIEAHDHLMQLHTINGIQSIKISMKDFQEKLPETHFLRIHRSFIINTNFIKSTKGNLVLMEDGEMLAIGTAYKKHFSELFQSIRI